MRSVILQGALFHTVCTVTTNSIPAKVHHFGYSFAGDWTKEMIKCARVIQVPSGGTTGKIVALVYKAGQAGNATEPRIGGERVDLHCTFCDQLRHLRYPNGG